ncbi:MAG: hypothetical protein VX228_12760, partial [Pseudomonadota bacterium]|nr:hypothetical protein [Pseudomonadota bacterium]
KVFSIISGLGHLFERSDLKYRLLGFISSFLLKLSFKFNKKVFFQNPDDNWHQDWRAGLEAWNDSVARIAALPPEKLQNFLFVQYEEIYSSPRAINALFTRLGLSNLEPEQLRPFVEKFAKLNEKLVPRRDDIRVRVAQDANWEAYKHLGSRLQTVTSTDEKPQ